MLSGWRMRLKQDFGDSIEHPRHERSEGLRSVRECLNDSVERCVRRQTFAGLITGSQERHDRIDQSRAGLALAAFVDACFERGVQGPAVIEPCEYGERRCAGIEFIEGRDYFFASV